ncbi:DUF262 domain-containing HNH endonuclease family protein [uncultured Veillonella sp.]|uniref:DUF262 domain-containing protein n=1 Tax=uncultured Veillonella sp. TaxID=159268 RepID=UPI0025D0358F|nr:DUF262 domain-containing HNH endonuclease family protein [uncultured Veillonella sp.]
MAEITSELKTLNDILDNENTFIIPDFQRSFVWGADEVNILFNDFYEDTNGFMCSRKELNNLPGYLLGNIVLIQNETDITQFEVIDGQQRLTTLTLLFCALYHKFFSFRAETGEVRWEKHALPLVNYYSILDRDFNFESVKILHNDSLEFKTTYQNIIKEGRYREEDNQSSNNIIEVYNAIEDNLDKLGNDDPELLINFKEYLTNRVKLIVTTAPSIDRAFQLFEVLNDRGQTLEPMDLLKNHFLKELSNNVSASKVDEFICMWNKFLKNLKASKKKISTSTFMKHFVLAKYGENIKKNNLLDYFKKACSNYIVVGERINFILSLAKDLEIMSQIYVSIEKDPLQNEFLEDDKALFGIFKLLKVTQLHPILMNFYKYDDKIKMKAASICAKYAAAVIFSFTQTNNIEKELPGIIKKIIEANTDEDKIRILEQEVGNKLKVYVKDMNHLLPTKDLASRDKRNSSKAVQLLKFIELYFCNNRSMMLPGKNNTELEHIMPYESDYEIYGYDSEENRINFLNRIGNLTLLLKNANSSAGNKTFNDKKSYYEESEFNITSTLVKEVQTSVASGSHKSLIDNINKYLYIKDSQAINLWSAEEITRRGEQITHLMNDLLLGQIK